MNTPPKRQFFRLLTAWVLTTATFGWAGQTSAAPPIHYFPSGTIYDYRWKLLELALTQTKDTDGPFILAAYAEDVTQNRSILLLESGAIDVVALGTNLEREKNMLPVKIDILRGIVGFRLLVIRAQDQERIAHMDAQSIRKELLFGLNSQWADLPVLRANGFSVITSSRYENLFGMLVAGRFDAFPRGLNEAQRELDERKEKYPQLAIEKSKALFFPYPIYFWVNKNNTALAQRIERGLRMALEDGSFRALFEKYHAREIAMMKRERRSIIMLDSPILPAGTARPDTSWWWSDSTAHH